MPEPNWGNSTPWPHQVECVDWLMRKRAGVIGFRMGGGKTYTSIVSLSGWGCKRILVLSPKSVVGVWRREFAKHCSEPHVVECLNGPVAKMAMQLQEFKKRLDPSLVSIVVVNYESAWRLPLAVALHEFKFDALVCDESHRIKSPTGRTSKYVAKLAGNVPYRHCLTGTFMPHSPLDAFAQMRVIEPRVFGWKYTAFRERYAVTHPQYKSHILKWINQDELKDKLADWVRYVDTRDVLELPELVNSTREFELGPKSRKAYRELETELVTLIDSEEITADNALVKLLRLQQITSGSMMVDDRQVDFGTEKADALNDILEDIAKDEPVVVYCRFRNDIKEVARIAKLHGRRFGQVSGERKDLTQYATMPEDIDILAVQQAAGGLGIDLTRSSIGIWYSLSLSLGDFDQSIARQHRPGQVNRVRMIHLVAKGTIDEAIYLALDRKRAVVESVMDALKSKVFGGASK